ncbi:MAG: hypothetical protein V8Q80_02185 [Barnesiella intestinihominis]
MYSFRVLKAPVKGEMPLLVAVTGGVSGFTFDCRQKSGSRKMYPR